MTKGQSLSNALDPKFNCVVSASAGTGKTWLLISRILRLLLDDAPPGNIVAITFTRKAAAEMQSRLDDRLREFATSSPSELRNLLEQLELSPDDNLVRRAQLLFEKMLHSTQRVKTTTYHAFCQEILRRFPLEADVPPGFELRQQTLSLKSEAWDTLFSESTQDSHSSVSSALEQLFTFCGSLHNTKSALLDFLEHRLDWWLLCESQEQPLNYALQKLANHTKLPSLEWSPKSVFSENRLLELATFSDLLNKHPTNTNQKHANNIHELLEICKNADYLRAFKMLVPVFLKKDGLAVSRKASKAQSKNMGETGQHAFLELHSTISDSLIDAIQEKIAITNHQTNRAWYTAGSRLIEIYQSIKLSKRLLDFDDLEWHCYQLLQKSESALWVQYKLDSRIDHLLIDEFQDTNPTQWKLILPLLQEMAASKQDRSRSVFLVGDTKQSIYRFRRAEPKLFKIAEQWLVQNLECQELHMSKSRRSAKVIMDFSNIVFSDSPLSRHMFTFPNHDTFHENLYGRVEIFPLIDPDLKDENQKNTDFRNPLEKPYPNRIDTRYRREANRIATTITTLIKNKTIIGFEKNSRHIEYRDIIILMRSRTHIAAYEQALRSHGISYRGGDKKGLLDCLEIQDMMALLEILVTPYNNLALAHVLRSPVFNASHEDLQILAESKSSWYEFLICDSSQFNSQVLNHAATLLSQWHQYASHLPVHDVLDKIFYEGDILKSYQRVIPDHLRGRVVANLKYLLDLALDIDSGRYPSMQMFLWNLQQAKAQTYDAPEQPDVLDNDNSIRLLTIHAAKGLEAPIVFLVDAARSAKAPPPYQSIIDWPIESDAPDQIVMRVDKKRVDRKLDQTSRRLAMDDEQEDANLLYVAITRAKQFLYISGVSEIKGNDSNWLTTIASQCQKLQWGQHSDNTGILCESGLQSSRVFPDKINSISEIDRTETVLIELPKLANKLNIGSKVISPSKLDESSSQPKAQGLAESQKQSLQRGQHIHRAIELLSNGQSKDLVRQLLLSDSDLKLVYKLEEYLNEASTVVNYPDFSYLFNDPRIVAGYNEIPLSYLNNDGLLVSGIIDRLVIHTDDVYVIDYKSHREIELNQQKVLAESYREQLALYARGVRKLIQSQRIHLLVLFTHTPNIIQLDHPD